VVVKLPWLISILYSGTHLEGLPRAIKTPVSTDGGPQPTYIRKRQLRMQVRSSNAESTYTLLDNNLCFHSNFAIKWGPVSKKQDSRNINNLHADLFSLRA
jgi:hypothetical protein